MPGPIRSSGAATFANQRRLVFPATKEGTLGAGQGSLFPGGSGTGYAVGTTLDPAANQFAAIQLETNPDPERLYVWGLLTSVDIASLIGVHRNSGQLATAVISGAGLDYRAASGKGSLRTQSLAAALTFPQITFRLAANGSLYIPLAEPIILQGNARITIASATANAILTATFLYNFEPE